MRSSKAPIWCARNSLPALQPKTALHCETVAHSRHGPLLARRETMRREAMGNAQDAGIDPGMSGLRARVQGHVSRRNQASGKVDLFAMSGEDARPLENAPAEAHPLDRGHGFGRCPCCG